MSDSDYQIYAAGDMIFAQGQPGDVMYIVKEGEVEIRLGDQILDTIGPEGFFGEMALIDDAPRSASAVAKTHCKLSAVNQKRFLFMVQQTPFFAIRLLKAMSARIRRHNEKNAQPATLGR
ncbi:MAG: cyclic nucleotide-binding domain-containing protein [Verrucomicrobiota bacterium]|jgi:CRP-like cAMP-binding protein